jgi:molybdopterin-binding protein
MGIRPEDVVLQPVPQEAAPSSARNRLLGRIARITNLGPLVRLVIDCGFPLVSLITKRSLDDLALSEGKPVLATFKASAVHIIRQNRRADATGHPLVKGTGPLLGEKGDPQEEEQGH